MWVRPKVQEGGRLATVEGSVEMEAGDPFAIHAPAPAWSIYRGLRLGADLFVALVLLVILAPLLAATALAIRLDSPGPALFRQRRVGLRGRPFSIYKFRTMYVSAPRTSLKVTIESPLITRVGRVLRKSGLDELPQLLNVVRGEMALIGPRPEQMELHSLYETWQLERLSIRPGITGWWQVHHRDNTPLHLNVDKDIFYVRHQSPVLDLEIMWLTAAIVLRGLLSRPAQIPDLDPVTANIATGSAGAGSDQLSRGGPKNAPLRTGSSSLWGRHRGRPTGQLVNRFQFNLRSSSRPFKHERTQPDNMMFDADQDNVS